MVLAAQLARLNAQQIVNGQIFTPGIAIIDAPQPNTPLGGGEALFLQMRATTLTASRFPRSRS